MKKLLFTLTLALMASTFIFAQVQPLSNNIKGAKADKSRGADPNIVVEKATNAAKNASNVVQPATKGAEQSRGGYCYLTFDNWTNYYVDCYVNGYNQGYVAPYGKGAVTVTGGDTKVYAVANFDDGSKLTWGPETKYCYNQEWTCTLY